MRFHTFRMLALLLLTISYSCKTSPPKPVTKEEAKEFATKLEVSVRKRETAFFNEAIDKKEMLKRADFPESGDSRSFRKGMERGMQMGDNIDKSLTAKGTYSLVKQYEKDGRQHLIFRLYDNGSLNYHDLELIHLGEEVKIADIFVYTTGQLLSETLHGVFVQMKGMMDKNSGLSADDEWVRRMPEIRTLLTQEKYQEALDLYEQMPVSVKNIRAMQIVHIEICSGMDMEQYDNALKQYQTLYPNEPNMNLLMIDGYIMHKEFDKALEAVNALDKQINTDPMLDYYRYLCYNLLDDQPKGIASLEKLMKTMPDFEEGAIELIATYLQVKDYDKARPLIKKFRARASFNQATLNLILATHIDFTE